MLEEKRLTPEEVKIILLSLGMMLEDYDAVKNKKNWNEEGRKNIQQMVDAATSAKKKLEAATMGGAEMKVPAYEPGDEKEFMNNTIEREFIDIPNDQGTPKLRRLVAEINDILVAENVAGIIVLHTPGVSEFLLNLSPSYSCMKKNKDGYHLYATAKEHGKEGRNKLITDTSNMLELLAIAASKPMADLFSMKDQMEETLKAKGGGTFHYNPIEKDEQRSPTLEQGEFQFKGVSRVTLKHVPGNKISSLVSTDILLEVLGPIDAEVYTSSGIPTKEGTKSLTIALAHGLVANIHAAHTKGWWDSAEHLRYIIGLLEDGFVEVVYPTEGIF